MNKKITKEKSNYRFSFIKICQTCINSEYHKEDFELHCHLMDYYETVNPLFVCDDFEEQPIN